MNFTVIWAPTGRRLLASVVTTTADRNAVTRAANYIDRLLMLDPLHEGKPYRRGYRKLFVTPLTVEYSVDVRNHIVKMVHVEEGDTTP